MSILVVPLLKPDVEITQGQKCSFSWYTFFSHLLTRTNAAAGWAIQVGVTNETTAITTGTKLTFRMPFDLTLNTVRASLTTAQSGGSIFTVNIKLSGTTIFSTKLTIDNNERTSVTAATQPVLSTTFLPDDGEISISVDQVGTAGAIGLKITMLGSR